MRRLLAVAVALVVALGVMAAPAQAQAPAPKVTINGLIDMVSAYTKNISMEDLAATDRGDSEWYSRTRLRPDIVAEVGTTKAVIGLEVDYIWGEASAARFGFSAPQAAAGRLNMDQQGILELKWGYLEFDLPVIPVATRVRLGGQPAAVTYKPGVFWGGDFAGVHITSAPTPMFKANFTYAQVQERSFGAPRFTSGDDFALAVSVDITPFKGLEIKPLYSYFYAEGATSGSSRVGRGGVSNTAAFFPNPGTAGGRAVEQRHTLGVDARWRSGPFSLAPTIFYQTGTRDIAPTPGAALVEADISAWYVDIRPGFTAGPLLLEGFLIYTTGNKAGDNLPGGAKVKHFQPINLDSGFYGGIADIWALNIDYLSAVYGTAGGLGFLNSIGYDKYGLINIGGRATYSLTPALAFRGGAHARWTAEKVDTDGTIAAASGLTPVNSGDDRFLGVELNAGLTWRFAPNVAFDLVGAYLIAGDALGSATSVGIDGITRANNDPKDIQKIAARVRYTF